MQLVIVRYHLLKQLRLIPLQPPHHGPFPPLTASTSGNHCSRKSSTDFCNKIGTKPTWHDVRLESVMRSKPDID